MVRGYSAIHLGPFHQHQDLDGEGLRELLVPDASRERVRSKRVRSKRVSRVLDISLSNLSPDISSPHLPARVRRIARRLMPGSRLPPHALAPYIGPGQGFLGSAPTRAR